MMDKCSHLVGNTTHTYSTPHCSPTQHHKTSKIKKKSLWAAIVNCHASRPIWRVYPWYRKVHRPPAAKDVPNQKLKWCYGKWTRVQLNLPSCKIRNQKCTNPTVQVLLYIANLPFTNFSPVLGYWIALMWHELDGEHALVHYLVSKKSTKYM